MQADSADAPRSAPLAAQKRSPDRFCPMARSFAPRHRLPRALAGATVARTTASAANARARAGTGRGRIVSLACVRPLLSAEKCRALVFVSRQLGHASSTIALEMRGAGPQRAGCPGPQGAPTPTSRHLAKAGRPAAEARLGVWPRRLGERVCCQGANENRNGQASSNSHAIDLLAPPSLRRTLPKARAWNQVGAKTPGPARRSRWRCTRTCSAQPDHAAAARAALEASYAAMA